mgnify:CR=1 FL=1
MEQQQKILTFWDHLEELRHVLFRIAVAVVFLMLVAFLFKDELFAIVLAPKNADFIIYRFFCRIADFMAMPSLCPEVFYVKMINTQLAAQFITHMSVSFYTGFLLASPYVIYQLFRFVSPALYENEKKYSTRIVGWGYFLLDTLMMMSLMMGIVFEIPVLCWLFAKLGFLTADFMKRYRRHAIVIILIVGAVITPTSDVFTLMMVSVPMYLLYEVSIWIVSRIGKKQREESVEEVLEKS